MAKVVCEAEDGPRGWVTSWGIPSEAKRSERSFATLASPHKRWGRIRSEVPHVNRMGIRGVPAISLAASPSPGWAYRAGRSTANQPAAARADENVHVFPPLLPATPWTPSLYSWRLPPRSHRSVIPAGPVTTTDTFEEFMLAPPISIAPGIVVVTAGTVRLLTTAELAPVLTGASSGFVLLTPLYRAMPALPVVADENVQL